MEYLTMASVAKHLGLSRQRVYHMAHQVSYSHLFEILAGRYVLRADRLGDLVDRTKHTRRWGKAGSIIWDGEKAYINGTPVNDALSFEGVKQGGDYEKRNKNLSRKGIRIIKI